MKLSYRGFFKYKDEDGSDHQLDAPWELLLSHPDTVNLVDHSTRRYRFVRIGNCKIAVTPNNQVKDFWTGAVESKELKLTIDLESSSAGILVSITPLVIPPKCLAGYSSEPGELRIQKFSWHFERSKK